MTSLNTMVLKDGRQFAVSVSGPEDGIPFVFHPMTPNTGSAPHVLEQAAHAKGLRVVSLSRPGYSGSTRSPGRSVADVAQDTEEILDQLTVRRCLMAGLSGGGPHALAAAAHLPDRVAAVVSIAGLAPSDRPDLEFLAGRDENGRREFELAFKGEEALHSFLVAMADSLKGASSDIAHAAFKSRLSPVDQAAFKGDLADDLIKSTQDAMVSGIYGWLDDDLAFTRSWGFNPEDITVPVFVWQGDEDHVVPHAHGRWLAENIPGAFARLETGEGHVSLLNRAEHIIDDIVSAWKK